MASYFTTCGAKVYNVLILYEITSELRVDRNRNKG